MGASHISLSVYLALGLLVPSSTAQVIYEDLHLVPGYLKAHGIVIALVFTVLLPVGVFILRFGKSKNIVWIHAAWQTLSWVLMIAGFASGFRAGKIINRVYNNAHTILGTIIVALLLLQPFIGLIHHFRLRRTQERGVWTHVHVWYGRVLMLLGMINGGLGLRLAANTVGGKAAYGAVAGVFGVAFIFVMILFESRKLPRWTASKATAQQEMEQQQE